jgi:hypothetical protein
MRAGLALLRLGVLGLGLLAAGCENYQWGTPGHLSFSTLYVAPVRNKTMAPQLNAVTSNILREAFLGDGRVQLVNSPDGADATLEVTITRYVRDVAAVREQDTGLASKFSITVATQCTLTNNATHHPFFANRVVETKRDVFTDNGNPHSSLVGDQLQSEYNTAPLIAQ